MMNIMTKMSQFIESIILLNEIILVICICEDEKEKKEQSKVYAEKIRRSTTYKINENSKRKMNKILDTSDEEEEVQGEDTQIKNKENIEKSTIKINVKGLEEYILKCKMKKIRAKE